ncbi:hypothetical protein [Paraflavitalea speifideaquila]|uniref:tetratricopeptide repeat protein n=1 Tax=Paraflavitalea speifideaquila TaxID=3076558 RepID=UPI0028E8A345|nr:hypothetical protein [Paraflavitalea speifideiaquila]
MVIDPDIAALQFKLSDSYRETGNLSGALKSTLQAQQVYEGLKDDYFFLCCLERTGMINSLMGNTAKAAENYEELNHRAQELCFSYPTEQGYKRLLGASFEKLGEMHAHAGDREKGLYNFELMLQAFRELTAAYPDDDDNIVRLATGCSKVGYAYKQLDRLQEANELFEEGLSLFGNCLKGIKAITL